MNTEKETQKTEITETEEPSVETTFETEIAEETVADVEKEKLGIGELLPIGKEDGAEAETAETIESTEEPLDDGFFGNINLPSASFFLFAFLIVSALLLILLVDKFRTKKPTLAKEAENDSPKTPDVTPKDSVSSAVVHGIGAREDQQDSYSISDLTDQSRGVMAVVADGMGGLSNGSLVSGILAKTFRERFRTFSEGTPADDILIESALYANAEVNRALSSSGKSGSTLVSVLIRDGRLHFLTVGDSHLYLYRNGALLLLNREHVYSEELAVKAVNRMIPTERIKNDRQAKSLTSYFGIGNIPYVDRSSVNGIRLVKGDKLLLCSDGVYGTLSEDRLEDSLSLPITEAAREIDEGIRFADAPHQDNYTALILEYNG